MKTSLPFLNTSTNPSLFLTRKWSNESDVLGAQPNCVLFPNPKLGYAEEISSFKLSGSMTSLSYIGSTANEGDLFPGCLGPILAQNDIL